MSFAAHVRVALYIAWLFWDDAWHHARNAKAARAQR